MGDPKIALRGENFVPHPNAASYVERGADIVLQMPIGLKKVPIFRRLIRQNTLR